MTDIKSKKDEQNWAVFQDLEYEFKPVRAEILAIHSRPNYIKAYLDKIPENAEELDKIGYAYFDCAQSCLSLVHLVPFSKLCWPDWKSSVRFLAGVDENHNMLTNKQAATLFNGFKLPEQDDSDVIESGQDEFLGAALANMTLVKSGRFYMHKYPTMALLPILSEKQVLEWNGEAYDALVLASQWSHHEIYYETGGRRRPQPQLPSPGRRVSEVLPGAGEGRGLAQDGVCAQTGSIIRPPGEGAAPAPAPQTRTVAWKRCEAVLEHLRSAGRLPVPDPDRLPAGSVFRAVRFDGSAFDPAHGALVPLDPASGHPGRAAARCASTTRAGSGTCSETTCRGGSTASSPDGLA